MMNQRLQRKLLLAAQTYFQCLACFQELLMFQSIEVYWETFYLRQICLKVAFCFPLCPAIITRNLSTLYDDVWSINGVSFEILTVPNWVRQQGKLCMNTGYLLRVPLVLLLIPYLKSKTCDVPDRTGCYGDDYNFTGDWDCRCQTKHQILFRNAFRTKEGRRKEDMRDNTLVWKTYIRKLHFTSTLQKLHLSLNISCKRWPKPRDDI